jgi:hypothetical protein
MTDQLTDDYEQVVAQTTLRAALNGPQAIWDELADVPLSYALRALVTALCMSVGDTLADDLASHKYRVK